MKRKVESSSDFISDLPLSILHHILSYLSSKDSVRTSVLSKQWNSAQKSFPILRFSTDHFDTSSPPLMERLHAYLDYVDRSLQNFVRDKLSIERMDLDMSMVDRGSVPLVNTWLPLALHNGVIDLRVEVKIVKEDYVDAWYYYVLPETTFEINSSLLCGSSEFFLLKKLELSNVFLTEKIVQDLIRSCPNLSDLNLSYFYGLETLIISKLDKLVSLTILVVENRASIFVDALSLQRFSLEFENDSKPCEIDLTSCRNLREFTLDNSSITDAQLNMNISRFPLLEALNIIFCENLRRISISLQRLKHLKLDCCKFEAIEINAPVLSEFVFMPSCDCEELPVLILADANPNSMCITYTKYEDGDVDSFRFLEIREFLTVPFKDITLCLDWRYRYDYRPIISFDIDELREYVIPPLVEITCLDLSDLKLGYPSNWEPLLDGLLWSCHPKTISMSTQSFSSAEDNCVKALCSMLNRSECQLCSNLSHCKCWRRRFKAATINTCTLESEEINVTSITSDLLSNLKYCTVKIRFDWDRSAIE